LRKSSESLPDFLMKYSRRHLKKILDTGCLMLDKK